LNTATYRSAVVAFKRKLIETTLREHGGNRTHAARALGVQRTYLLRLIRDLGGNTTPLARSSMLPRARDPPMSSVGTKIWNQNEIGEPRVAQLPDSFGGPSRTRTLDPLIKSQLLYQLS
jgi:hypothetical protein